MTFKLALKFLSGSVSSSDLQLLLPRVSDTTYQKNTLEKAVACSAFILLLVKRVFLFNKSSKKEQHITMKAVGLQHCTCIFTRHSCLPLSLVHAHTHITPLKQGVLPVSIQMQARTVGSTRSAFKWRKMSSGNCGTPHLSYTGVVKSRYSVGNAYSLLHISPKLHISFCILHAV